MRSMKASFAPFRSDIFIEADILKQQAPLGASCQRIAMTLLTELSEMEGKTPGYKYLVPNGTNTGHLDR